MSPSAIAPLPDPPLLQEQLLPHIPPPPPAGDPVPAKTPAQAHSDLVSKEELKKALLLHLQAPAISESQQGLFKK
jgi:hypothetical protein